MKKDFVEGNLFLHLLGHLKGKYQRSFQGILKKAKKISRSPFLETGYAEFISYLIPAAFL